MICLVFDEWWAEVTSSWKLPVLPSGRSVNDTNETCSTNAIKPTRRKVSLTEAVIGPPFRQRRPLSPDI